MSDLITIKEAGRRMAVSRQTIEARIKEGLLTKVPVGPRAVRLREEEVESLPLHYTTRDRKLKPL